MVGRIIQDINGQVIMAQSKTEIKDADKVSFISCVEAYNINETIYQRLVNTIDGTLATLKETSPREHEVNSNLIWICHFLQMLSTDTELKDTTIQKHTSGIGVTDAEYVVSTIYKFINQLGVEETINKMFGYTNRIIMPVDFSADIPNEEYTEPLQDELLIAQREASEKGNFELRGEDNY